MFYQVHKFCYSSVYFFCDIYYLSKATTHTWWTSLLEDVVKTATLGVCLLNSCCLYCCTNRTYDTVYTRLSGANICETKVGLRLIKPSSYMYTVRSFCCFVGTRVIITSRILVLWTSQLLTVEHTTYRPTVT